jgi:hypothetical protein
MTVAEEMKHKKRLMKAYRNAQGGEKQARFKELRDLVTSYLKPKRKKGK